MAIKTKTISVPSLRIDVAFLDELGKIIEINNGKGQDKSINYTINSPNEQIEFGSILELKSTQLLPSKIESIICRIADYSGSKNKVVSVYMDLDSHRLIPTPKLKLSCENEGKLLFIENQIKKLFEKYKTNYSFLYEYFLKTLGSTIITMVVIIAILGVALIRLVLFLSNNLLHLKLNTLSTFIISYVILLILYFPGSLIFTDIFPRHLFELSGKNKKRNWVIVAFATILLAAIYDLLKSIFTFILFK